MGREFGQECAQFVAVQIEAIGNVKVLQSNKKKNDKPSSVLTCPLLVLPFVSFYGGKKLLGGHLCPVQI